MDAVFVEDHISFVSDVIDLLVFGIEDGDLDHGITYHHMIILVASHETA